MDGDDGQMMKSDGMEGQEVASSAARGSPA